MSHGATPAPRAMHGFSMLEVMLALVVLSIGLLGMAALMGTSVRNTQSANYRTQATNLAYDVIDMVRSNSANAGFYQDSLGAYTDPDAVCEEAPEPIDYDDCGSAHACDILRWSRDLCMTLPNGRGRIDITRAANGSLDMSVDVCWTDDRTSDDADAACDGDSQTLFTVTTGL